MTTKFDSLTEARQKAPTEMMAHLGRSREFHRSGLLLMAGAFVDRPDQPVTTMGILTSREAAEEYARHDPFVEADLVAEWSIREWANLVA